MSIRASSCAVALLTLALAASVMGCTKDSADLSTKSILATFDVKVDPLPAPGTTKVTADLKDPTAPAGMDYVKLSNGDGLTITTDKGDNLPLGAASDADGRYQTTLMNADRTSFVFHFKRASGDSSDATVTMPATLALTDSPNNKSYAATDMVHFAWSNTVGQAGLTLSADHRNCTADIAVALGDTRVKDLPFPDSGTLDVPVSMLYPGTPTSGDCVDISITRSLTQYAMGAFDRMSGITGRRVDHYTIHIK